MRFARRCQPASARAGQPRAAAFAAGWPARSAPQPLARSAMAAARAASGTTPIFLTRKMVDPNQSDGDEPPTSSLTFVAPTITASTPARSSSATSSGPATGSSAIASLPAGTSGRSSSTRSSGSSSSGAARTKSSGSKFSSAGLDDARVGAVELVGALAVPLEEDRQGGCRAERVELPFRAARDEERFGPVDLGPSGVLGRRDLDDQGDAVTHGDGLAEAAASGHQ